MAFKIISAIRELNLNTFVLLSFIYLPSFCLPAIPERLNLQERDHFIFQFNTYEFISNQKKININKSKKKS